MTLIALIISDLFPGEEFKDTDLPKLLTDAIAHFENTTDMELSPGEDYLLFFVILVTKYYGLQIFTASTRKTFWILSVPSPLFVLLFNFYSCGITSRRFGPVSKTRRRPSLNCTTLPTSLRNQILNGALAKLRRRQRQSTMSKH
jgi:hypothetical protein